MFQINFIDNNIGLYVLIMQGEKTQGKRKNYLSKLKGGVTKHMVIVCVKKIFMRQDGQTDSDKHIFLQKVLTVTAIAHHKTSVIRSIVNTFSVDQWHVEYGSYMSCNRSK